MPLFGPPNIEKMESKNDFKGLINALGYKKDSLIPSKAAIVLSQMVIYGSNKNQVIDSLKAKKQTTINAFISALSEDHSQWDKDKLSKTLEVLEWPPDKSEAGFQYWVGKRDWDKVATFGVKKLLPLLEESSFKIPERVDLVLAIGKTKDPSIVDSLLIILNNDRENEMIRKASAKSLSLINIEELNTNKMIKFGNFEDVSTKNLNKAIKILFDEALNVSPVLNQELIENQYSDVKPRWGSLALIEGSQKEIRSLVLKNLKHIKENFPQFMEFNISTVLYARAAQISALHGDYFTPIRVWKKDDKYFVCGNSTFLTN